MARILRCHRCGYIWLWSGTVSRSSCPDCGTSIYPERDALPVVFNLNTWVPGSAYIRMQSFNGRPGLIALIKADDTNGFLTLPINARRLFGPAADRLLRCEAWNFLGPTLSGHVNLAGALLKATAAAFGVSTP